MSQASSGAGVAFDRETTGQEMKDTTMLDRRALLATLTAGVAATALPAFGQPRAAKRSLAGVFPIAFTPNRPDGKVDFDGLASQIAFLRRGGVHGVAWPQIASGWTTLDEGDRIKGAEVSVQAARGGKTAVIIGVQSRTGDFAEIERYARHAEKIGADGVICIPPTGVDQAGLLSLYQRLGKTTSLPVMVQAVGDVPVDLLVKMYETIPTVRYVKDEAGDPLARVPEITRRTHGEMKSFSGRGVYTMISEMEAGFSGHCPFTSIADVYATAYDQFHAGNRRAAFETFGRIQAASSMFSQSNINVLIARGVFKPGTTSRLAAQAPGANTSAMRANTPAEIKRVLDTYMKPYLRA
jgi:dihydrodipicolinate synthase/N-acetylneuraminate lyase